MRNSDEKDISREDQANIEIGHTEFRRGVPGFLVAVFLVTISTVPAVQHFEEVRQHLAGARASGIPQCYDILSRCGEAVRHVIDGDGGAFHRIVAADRMLLKAMNSYESDLEDSSWLTKLCLPVCQQVLVERLGVGNEKTYPGRDGWLFYRQDVEYLTGPGFLEWKWRARRNAAHKEWELPPAPDAVVAIMDFKRQLEKRGIVLVVAPIPPKTVIHSELFASRGGVAEATVQNASLKEFVAQLRAGGVEVFDASDVLLRRKAATGQPQYLATDTHWLPDAMDAVAGELAELVSKSCQPAPGGGGEFNRRSRIVENLGDLAVMLRLSDRQTVFPTERVELQQVVGTGGRWLADQSADILLLGDSFSNIYSLKTMGWGESAGLAEQLSCRLQRPLDRIVRNDEGSFATREALARELSSGRDRLQGKKVVIWEFAARELAFGNWKVIKLQLVREADFQRSRRVTGQ
ncbi:MAG: hypothetical protein C0404_02730 [Verrucomicrobia bacterium]|nr:hypothetical protein [Verrucomicrobiota bacterium]